MNTLPLKQSRFKKIIGSPAFAYGVFWSWNLLYMILFISLEVTTGLTYSVISDGITGSIPVSFTLSALVVYTIPFLSIILGFSVWRKQPKKLLKLFYGAEVPLTLFFLLRLSMIRETNAGSLHLLLLFACGMLSYLFFLFREKVPSSEWISSVFLVLKCSTFLIGVYVALLLIGYVVPIAAISVEGLFDIDWNDIRHMSFLIFIWFIFFCYSLTLFFGLPFALIYLYTRSFIQYLEIYKASFSATLAYALTAGFILLNLGLYVFLNWNQKQEDTFAFLDKKDWSSSDIQEFHNREQSIKDGLVNAYLASYRYLSPTTHNDAVEHLFEEAFGGNVKDYHWIQIYNNALLKPFLYDGDFYEDRSRASSLYEHYFEQPIQKDQRAAVQHALNSTWERAQAAAGVMDIDEERVLVISQELTVEEHGQWADIELYEQYQNQTFDRQEIFYYFSLPEDAVITGLWLSDDSIKKKYSYRVSPRGAAQQVYNNIVSERQDPSLLEQTGPGMYRLRAFPIMPKSYQYGDEETYRERARNKKVQEGDTFHLWLSYRVLNDGTSSWPLPVLLEKRNVYMTNDTHFSINNTVTEKSETGQWLPASVAMKKTQIPADQILSLEDGTVLKSSVRNSAKDIRIPNGNYAVVIDGSYSMIHHSDKTKELVSAMSEQASPSIQMDFYIAGKNPALINNTATAALDYFGHYEQIDLLAQFERMKKRSDYTSVILLTDEGNYETDYDSSVKQSYVCPVYILHVNGAKASAYSDALLESIQAAGGKIGTSLPEIVEHITVRQQYAADTSFLGMNANRVWTLQNASPQAPSELSANAAGVYITHLAADIRNGDITGYDKAHSLALSHGIVSNYSSMIVLVNDQQHKQLDELENADDRFKRETEKGTEVISSPMSFGDVSGTPEPEEWLLIGIAGTILLYTILKKRIVAFR